MFFSLYRDRPDHWVVQPLGSSRKQPVNSRLLTLVKSAVKRQFGNEEFLMLACARLQFEGDTFELVARDIFHILGYRP